LAGGWQLIANNSRGNQDTLQAGRPPAFYDRRMTDHEQFWRALVTGDAGVMRRERRRHRRIPGAPRCKTCLVPLGGLAAPMVRLVLKRRPSAKNPNYCDVCETFVRTHPGGAEVEISMLFADVRGSTTLAEQMQPMEFSRLMNRFFDCANRVVIDSEGLVDKLVGDEVVALYVPAVGSDHARKAVEAAGDLLRATADLVPVGAGVHTGVAYVGSVGSDSTVADFTALGDAVNVTARLASLAGAGEALISEAAYTASGFDVGDFERRELSVKGRDAPLAVRILRA
jgi:adenylate cyclase